MSVIQASVGVFSTLFDEPSFQEALHRLYFDLGNHDPEEWARSLYLTLRHDPSNDKASMLNMDRKKCLQLLYDLVDAWESSTDPSLFEEEICRSFHVERLYRILYVGVIMDRSQALYRMQIPTSSLFGMHWYAKSHLSEGMSTGLSAEELRALKAALVGYPGFPTMNRRIYKMLHTERFGLLQADRRFVEWAKPCRASFEKVAASSFEEAAFKSARPMDGAAFAVAMDVEPTPISPPTTAFSDEQAQDNTTAGTSVLQPKQQVLNMVGQDSFHAKVAKYVQAYDNPVYQERLERLYHDRDSKDPEEWAKELYLTFRDDNVNKRALMLNQDRKVCLNLLYDMVNEWKEHGFCKDFELAIAKVFKPRRIARILGVCLVMDRAQSLYKMILPAKTSQGESIIGMHWFCELHFQDTSMFSSDERKDWMERLSKYSGTATMNKRLYRLLHSEVLGLCYDKAFVHWSKPHAAEFVYVKLPAAGVSVV
ncbi:hypothetical protein ACA910_020395 [Epithemia clementina (nom. ined.)]